MGHRFSRRGGSMVMVGVGVGITSDASEGGGGSITSFLFPGGLSEGGGGGNCI